MSNFSQSVALLFLFLVCVQIGAFIAVWCLPILASHMLCQIVSVINHDSVSLNVKAKFFFSFLFFFLQIELNKSKYQPFRVKLFFFEVWKENGHESGVLSFLFHGVCEILWACV